jgi:hypothetical protein
MEEKMTIIDLINEIRETYKDGLENSKVMKEYYVKSEDDLDRIVKYLTSLFLGDTEVQKLVENNDLKGLGHYIETIKSDLLKKYEWLLTGYGDTELCNAIEKNDFNDIYRQFKEAKKNQDNNYMDRIPNPTLDEKREYLSKESVLYQEWNNLLRYYYESVMKGDFSGVINLYKTMQILPSTQFLIGKLDWESKRK